MDEEKSRERKSTPASFGELCGLMVIGAGLVVTFDLTFEWLETEWGLIFLGIGRRLDLGSFFAMVLAYYLTRMLAAALGIRSKS